MQQVRYLALAFALLACGSWALTEAKAQSDNNIGRAWSGVYKNSSPNDRRFGEIRALEEHALSNGGGAGGVIGGNNYYGTVNQNFNGPTSFSESQVLNIGTNNSTTTTTNASGGSTVIVDNINDQTANNATQSGAANANAATGDNATQSGSATNQNQ